MYIHIVYMHVCMQYVVCILHSTSTPLQCVVIMVDHPQVSIDDCSSGIIRVSDRSQTIDPLLYGEFIFEVSTSINEDMNHTCSGEHTLEAL